MKYRSTRGGVEGVSFVDAVLMGLAPDRGLLVPEVVPSVSAAMLAEWKKIGSFEELAFEIMSLYISREEISAEELRNLTKGAYASFRSPEVTPVVDLSGMGTCEEPNVYLLELFHGPTFAFKDVALQFLGRLFELILKKKEARGETSKTLTIVGATSGDTGSSAIYGVRGRENVECFILYPEGRTSKIQEAQMATVPDENVHAIAVANAEFDDCQKIVKGLFGDETFRERHSLGAVNSINWARILAQITYYFWAAFKLDKKEVWFSVPTGNFGDVLAGYYAKIMGCPLGKLLVATNDNDILCKFFETGVYKRQEGGATPTLAPSMDICVSSNFERFLFHCASDNSTTCRDLMANFETHNSFQADKQLFDLAKTHMRAHSVDEKAILSTISQWYTETGYVLDPHTACGVAAGLKLRPDASTTLVCLACAHHAKFPDAVEKAIGKANLANLQPKETALTDLLDLPLRNVTLQNDIRAVADFIDTTMQKKQHKAISSPDKKKSKSS